MEPPASCRGLFVSRAGGGPAHAAATKAARLRSDYLPVAGLPGWQAEPSQIGDHAPLLGFVEPPDDAEALQAGCTVGQRRLAAVDAVEDVGHLVLGVLAGAGVRTCRALVSSTSTAATSCSRSLSR